VMWQMQMAMDVLRGVVVIIQVSYGCRSNIIVATSVVSVRTDSSYQLVCS
jgi:hypothetical protein